MLFIASWLKGNGVVEVDGSVEDSATAEISRSQVLKTCSLTYFCPRCGSGSDTGQLWKKEALSRPTLSASWWPRLWLNWEGLKR